MLGYKNKTQKHVDLLLISNTKKLLYVLIKGFNRFMTNKTKHHDKNIFADIACNASLAQKY